MGALQDAAVSEVGGERDVVVSMRPYLLFLCLGQLHCRAGVSAGVVVVVVVVAVVVAVVVVAAVWRVAGAVVAVVVAVERNSVRGSGRVDEDEQHRLDTDDTSLTLVAVAVVAAVAAAVVVVAAAAVVAVVVGEMDVERELPSNVQDFPPSLACLWCLCSSTHSTREARIAAVGACSPRVRQSVTLAPPTDVQAHQWASLTLKQ